MSSVVILSGFFSSSLSDVEENGIRREACNNMKQLTVREVFHTIYGLVVHSFYLPETLMSYKLVDEFLDVLVGPGR